MPEDKDNSPRIRLTRRALLGTARNVVVGTAMGLGLGTGIFADAVEKGIQMVKEKTTGSDATPAMTPEPIRQSNNRLLEKTATAIADNPRKTSFIESDGFTKEIFEKVCRGTYNIYFNTKSDDGSIYEGGATAWLAEVDKDKVSTTLLLIGTF